METTNTQNRLRSWALWVALLGLFGLICQSTGLFEAIGLDSEEWSAIVTSVGTVLAAFGIINNPTSADEL